jgi:hypothetical protein
MKLVEELGNDERDDQGRHLARQQLTDREHPHELIHGFLLL